MNEVSEKAASSGTASVPVVGIGASAGGIEAFRSFFEAMPADSGLAFVVVLHLPAGWKSMLPEILQRWTAMPVSEAKDGETIRANHVLAVPAGAIATVSDGHMQIRQLPAGAPREPLPIDTLFDSMAATLGEQAIGVILSGTGHDGALGLKAIKVHGGLTLAQGVDSTAPQHSGMPDSAVAAGAVDALVPVQDMAGFILDFRVPRAVPRESASDAGQRIRRIRLAICAILRARLGHDFSHYKEQTLMRRVQRRMQVLKVDSLEDYVARLEREREQVVLLFRDLLISVTSFFRDPEAFAALEQIVMPRLFANKDADSVVRVWVPGCATGEEAYSLAILLREQMDSVGNPQRVAIFGSDIDEAAIATARAGRYPASLLEGMAEERRRRFFARTETGFSVTPEIRELCTFSAHSLIRDPPFSRMDMISCRNLLIYLDNELQSSVIPTFHYSLVPDGILLLGTSETIPRYERLFAPLDRPQRIYRRREGPSELPRLVFGTTERVEPKSRVAPPAPVDGRADRLKAVRIAGRRVLERFAAPFVVVSASGEVLHYSSRVGKFLEPAAGAPTASLFDMARRGWGLELRALLRRCIESGIAVEQVRSVPRADGQAAETVRMLAEPLADGEDEPLYLIVFVDEDGVRGTAPAPSAAPTAWLPDGADSVVAQIESEARVLREQLQSITEEHGTAVEELRSSNEELQSINEELQSTNEELQTSKEEIQSINEELNTVNAQLSAKVELLDRANSDLQNLFDGTKVATVFLDAHLVIRNFTPAIASIYNLIPSDIGRSLTDIVSRLQFDTLREDVRHVLAALEPLERPVMSKDGTAHYLMRVLPYRTPDSSVDGSLVTFVDVTSLVQAEQHQRLLVDELNHRVKNMLTVVISLASQTLRRAGSLDGFREVFIGRLHALAAAYGLVGRDGGSRIPLREILAAELKPFMAERRANIVLDGPDVALEPRGALALGMAIHELTTNAVKYGALSVPEGNLAVTWTLQRAASPDELEARELELRWVERGGPVVSLPDRKGFGLTMIERGVAHDIGGSVAIDFAPEGLVAVFHTTLATALDPPPALAAG